MVDTYANRVHVDCSSSGTGNLTLGSAITTAYQSFSGAGITNGATFPYTAYTSTQFECGHGSYSTTGPVLVRTAGNVVAGSAGAGALTNFSTNPRVFLGPLAEDWPTGGGTPGGSTTQIQYNNAGAFAGMAGTAWDDTNRSLVVSGATITANKPLLDLEQTWNASGTTFSGFRVNIASTASATASKPMDHKINGTSYFYSSTDGAVVINQQTGAINVAALAVYYQSNLVFSVVSSASGGVKVSGPIEFQLGTEYINFAGSSRTYGNPTTVGSLPSAATAGKGSRHFVTDANATTFNTTVAAGGSNNVPVFSDGTNWKIG